MNNTHDPRNYVGQKFLRHAYLRKLRRVWDNTLCDPRNHIGKYVLFDTRRTSQIEYCRVGTRTNILYIV